MRTPEIKPTDRSLLAGLLAVGFGLVVWGAWGVAEQLGKAVAGVLLCAWAALLFLDVPGPGGDRR